MNRIEIKEKARKIIKGKLWEIWKPMLIIMLISATLSFLLDRYLPLSYNLFTFKDTKLDLDLSNSIITFLITPISIGFSLYILNFVRGKEFKIDDLFSKIKYVLPIWAIIIVIDIFTTVGFAFLVIPGIIISLMFIMADFVMADSDIKVDKVLKDSVDLMKGHKWDYFVFSLSFIGWILLCIITIGIAMIYVAPYITVARALYYEELKKLKA